MGWILYHLYYVFMITWYDLLKVLPKYKLANVVNIKSEDFLTIAIYNLIAMGSQIIVLLNNNVSVLCSSYVVKIVSTK